MRPRDPAPLLGVLDTLELARACSGLPARRRDHELRLRVEAAAEAALSDDEVERLWDAWVPLPAEQGR